ncbi:MAG: putative bifunctional diguanylate cyclase/phosphodiesterase, partial [Acidimicrobiia bacterium]
PVPRSGDILVSGRDVTERREAQRRVEESEQRFRSLFDNNSDAVYAFDLDGRFTMMNPAGERVTGWRVDEVLGVRHTDLMRPAELDTARSRFARAAAGEALTFETAIHHRDGRRIELDVTHLPIVVDDEVVGVFGLAKDVTQRRRLERQLGHQATHDALTGLPNRAHLESALVDAAGGDGERSLLFIDLDRFKLVNDSLGHRSGDELLVAAVERLRGSVRDGDLLARWAGDEFCVLLAPGTTEALALQVADRLRSALAEPFTICGRDVRLSASIGVASAGAGDAERLVQVADLAMYAAKRAGRDRVSVYSPGSAPAVTQLDLEAELAAALDSDAVSVHYQPIVATASGRIHAVEALARWVLADGTSRSPAEFVPVAEESGLIRELTRHVLADACRQLTRWDSLGGPGAGALQAWVNVSVVDLEFAGFAAEVGAALRAADLPPGRLVLEVTETTLMRDADQVDATIAELGDLGVALAIDDFGTGYSSLSRLHRLPVAACKIDRHFVAPAPERTADAVVLRALVDVGAAFGVAMVAEGIERPEELSAATDAGCVLVQGFLLGVPSPATVLDELIGVGRVELPVPDARRAPDAVASGR